MFGHCRLQLRTYDFGKGKRWAEITVIFYPQVQNLSSKTSVYSKRSTSDPVALVGLAHYHHELPRIQTLFESNITFLYCFLTLKNLHF